MGKFSDITLMGFLDALGSGPSSRPPNVGQGFPMKRKSFPKSYAMPAWLPLPANTIKWEAEQTSSHKQPGFEVWCCASRGENGGIRGVVLLFTIERLTLIKMTNG